MGMFGLFLALCALIAIGQPNPVNLNGGEGTCIMTDKGTPCEFPFIHRGVEYDTCVHQPARFWFPSYYWCYTVEGRRGRCDMSAPCESTTDDVETTTVAPVETPAPSTTHPPTPAVQPPS